MVDDPSQPHGSRRPWWLRITRDRILFLAGLAGFVHEMVLGDVTERPIFMLACTAMMGLPSFFPAKDAR